MVPYSVISVISRSPEIQEIPNWLFFNILKQPPTIFRCLGECCNAVLLLSSKNSEKKRHLTFHRHGGEWIMTQFVGELFL